MLDILDRHYNLDEFRELCFNLRIDYDNLGGEGKRAKARELIVYMQRHGRTQELVEAVKTGRPNINVDIEADSQYLFDTAHAETPPALTQGTQQQWSHSKTIIIDRIDVVNIFRRLFLDDSYRILRLTGSAKMGKTHLMTLFSTMARQEYRTFCASISLTSKLQSPADLMHTIAQQLGLSHFQQYKSTQNNISLQPQVEVNGLNALLARISTQAEETEQQHRERRLLTAAFMEDLAALPKEKPVIFLFDAFDNAEKTTQNWLFEHFITGLYPIPHVRAVIAGRTLPPPPITWQDMCHSHELQAVSPKDLRNYCDQIGVDDGLTDDKINEFHYIFDGKPGLFADLILPKYGKRTI